MTPLTTPDAGTEQVHDRRPRSLGEVKGWFRHADIVLFDWFLSRQDRLEQHGDLLEMGAYMGKSAIFLQAYLRAGERLTVCDLFDGEAPDNPNAREMQKSYSTLTRRAFEANFRAFHEELPRIIHGPTSWVPDEVTDASCRFVHVDASHLYEHVRGDIVAARAALGEEGVVVLDDYRAHHTPGVACAAWEAVVTGGLKPVCLTSTKFYGTWGDVASIQDELLATLGERDDCWVGAEEIAGGRVLRVNADRVPEPRLPRSRYAGEKPAPSEAGTGRVPASRGKKIAKDLLPPVVTRALRGLR
ncbi:class I SAM-dependent methyltransferase [Streptomyces sp. A7024]|uniref:Class I SAM-dependent methyltransferase n=1 Tax=Streptomyces coryli TaxID=1128680 RepID=A0A6G4TZ92_9ACTN|nr:class I SAM-dependent methyltransferase [Streptomyces coryli]